MSTERTVAEILTLLEARTPTLGAGRLLCVDGRAGSGKSTLAAGLAAADGATVVHTDDLCPGWAGLPRVPGLLAELVGALAAGGSGRHPRYDWLADQVAEDVVVEPTPLLVIEGVGAGSRVLAPWRTALVWLECPEARRREQALARDGEMFAPYWDAWAAAEETYLVTAADRANADLVIQR